MNTSTANHVPAKATEIRAALANNCLYVYHVWGEGLRARICDVRTRKGGLVQVKHLQQGTWHNVSDNNGHLVQG